MVTRKQLLQHIRQVKQTHGAGRYCLTTGRTIMKRFAGGQYSVVASLYNDGRNVQVYLKPLN